MSRTRSQSWLVVLASLVPCFAAKSQQPSSNASDGKLERIRVSDDRRGFVLAPSGREFRPWGFNYDHDRDSRLIEEYWIDEWATIEEDFREMKELGTNVVRIHLQLGKFMDSAEKPNEKSLEQLARLVALAERTGLYLDLTGLACYLKEWVPAWYDDLSESDRWTVQARFWAAIAKRCAASPAIFCYDLMNEPVSPAGQRKPGEWLGPPFAGKFHFVQMIALDQAGRERPEIARAWIKRLSTAIREHDKRHLITVGMVDWSLDRPGLTSGFVPSKVADELDFLCTHIYPKDGKIADALDTLAGFDVGKPVVIEETFPLGCPMPQFREFIDKSREHAAGVIGFYWGKTPAELKKGGTIGDAILLSWLEFFQAEAKRRRDER